MPKRIEPERWAVYIEARAHTTRAEAARIANISYDAARSFDKGDRTSSGVKIKDIRDKHLGPKPIPYERLGKPAQRAWNDFGYFRYRYFGRKSTPWQEEAAYKVVELMSTPRKEFGVLNCPPGSGKTSLFTHDIPLWLTVRNRGIAGLLGSATQSLAERYVDSLRRSLTNTFPVKADDDAKALGIAVDAQATLVGDYGAFKPDRDTVWSREQFSVLQQGGIVLLGKEPTWSAYGMDTKHIGGRYMYVGWDDLIDARDIRTFEKIEDRARWWDTVAEKRLEPAGVLMLVGQRLGPDDDYRRNADKEEGDEYAHDHDGCCDAEPGRKYHHFIYKAHYDDRCEGHHTEDAPYYPEGCLLDPRRVSWREQVAEQKQSISNYETVYQQEDADPSVLLVPRLWITGGRDPDTQEIFVGCLDHERALGVVPRGLGHTASVAMSDPSPTKYWAHQWWLYAMQTPEQYRYLIDVERKPMTAGEFLDWNNARQKWSGLMEEWWQRSKDLGRPITHWIFEENSGNRFVLQYEHTRRWCSARGVTILGHECVDTETDVLSDRGWLSYDEVQVGDRILTLNIGTQRAEWQPVELVYRGLHRGPMMRFDSRNIDSLCTVDHSWPAAYQHDRELRLVEARRLNSGHILPLARPLADDQEPQPVWDDDLVELVGWAVTEGWFDPAGNRIRIGQSTTANPILVDRLIDLFKRMDADVSVAEPHPYTGVVVFSLKGDVNRRVRALTGGCKALPPEFVSSLDAFQRHLLLEVLRLADGWTYGTTQNFCSDTESLIDAWEMLCALNGRPTYRTTRADRPQHHVVRVKQASDAYLQNKAVRPVVVEDFAGVVWCPRTVNGTFYARRGGKTFFTGNTQRNKADPEMGITILKPLYRHGKKRLPWAPFGDTQKRTGYLVNELTKWPLARTDDQVMADWFGEFNLPVFNRKPHKPAMQERPSWCKDGPEHYELARA